ncbi:MAG: FtsX-like permease family protein [Chitinophagales bacterium]|nr:FtsX-like permease family protein [Chitinophagales bacterium]
MGFIFKMAWRDSRRNRGRLFLFISAIMVGIAALTAVRSFSINLTNDVDREAKTLLGADLLLSAQQALPDSILQRVSAQAAEQSKVVNFMSMIRFPKNGATRLTQIRAIEGNYPYYGKWKTEPEAAWRSFRNRKAALIDHTLMLQFGIQPGDSVQIGEMTFVVEGDLLSAAGRAGIASAIAPVAFIPAQWLDSTGLVQRGSRIDYQYYFQMPPQRSADELIKPLEKDLEKAAIRDDTVESRKRNVGRAFGNFGTFLNLVGFIALLLGCIGVAGAVHIYIKDKLPTVAILRCLGAKGRQAFYVYLVQVAGIGLLGAIGGAALGALIQKILPWVLRDLLPLEEVSTDFSFVAAGQGILLGLSVAVLFALLPLSGILRTSPLRTLRAAYGENENSGRGLRWAVYLLIAASVFLFTWWLIGGWLQTLYFIGGIGVAFGILFGIARLMTWGLRRFFPRRWSYTTRQGIANLFRPENQTMLLVISIGLGTMLLSTLFLIQSLLLKQLEFSGSGNQPNMVLFDIQKNDVDSVSALLKFHKMPIIQQAGVVTTRVETIDGRTKLQDEADTLKALPGWVWDREYRVTYRDTLLDTEKITQGAWSGVWTPGEPIKVSVSSDLAKAMKAEIGTKLTFNVQGTRMETEVASVREINFNRVQPAFMVLFPKGVLEQAPQFHFMVTRVESEPQSAAFQSSLVQRYPGISAIDLTQILKSVDEVLSKVSFVIRFMALFSILTGLLVLVSSIYQSKYARIRESVLLRTLGASRRQILGIYGMEYFLLGALSCLSGVGLSVFSAWALVKFVFQIPFEPQWLPLVLTFASITALTVLIGLLNTRDAVRKPPLEVLRSEV